MRSYLIIRYPYVHLMGVGYQPREVTRTGPVDRPALAQAKRFMYAHAGPRACAR